MVQRGSVHVALTSVQCQQHMQPTDRTYHACVQHVALTTAAPDEQKRTAGSWDNWVIVTEPGEFISELPVLGM